MSVEKSEWKMFINTQRLENPLDPQRHNTQIVHKQSLRTTQTDLTTSYT